MLLLPEACSGGSPPREPGSPCRPGSALACETPADAGPDGAPIDSTDGDGNADADQNDGAEAGTPLRTCAVDDQVRSLPRFQFELPDGSMPPNLAVSATVYGAGYQAAGIASVTRVDVDNSCATCSGGTLPTVRIAIAQPDGQTSTLVTFPPPELVDTWLATAQELAGTQVSLTVGYSQEFQFPTSSGFVLTDGSGLVFAANVGPHLDAISAPPPLSVGLGDPICITDGSSCQEFVRTNLAFMGDSTAVVGMATDGALTIGGRSYAARNGGAGYNQGPCLGSEPIESGTFWSIWRLPAS